MTESKLNILKEDPSEFGKDPFEDANQITKHIWLGNRENLYRPHFLIENDIGGIVNCAVELKQLATFIDGKEIPYKTIVPKFNLDLYDNPEQVLNMKDLKEAFDFINMMIKCGKKVYVNCHAGISRSASVLCAYLMVQHKLTFEQVSKLIKSLRPQINPNSGFVRQLKQLSEKISLDMRVAEIQHVYLQKEITKLL